eukprot:7733709-Pyramimonas_sp.AAC.1
MTLKLQKWQQFRTWTQGRFQHVVLALTSRAFVLKYVRASRVEGGSFSNCASRLSAAHTRSKQLQ